MDLTTLWQENRTFILSVTAGFLLFFVGQGVISSLYPVDDQKRSVERLHGNLRRVATPTPDHLDEMRTLNEDLKAQCDAALKRVAFIPDPRYILSRKEKPDIQYDRLFNEARDTLVEGAKTLNISVDGNLGMPELSPTRPLEIQRALTALDVVTRVVLLALEAQVGVIDAIAMVPESGRKRDPLFGTQRVRFKMTASQKAMADFFQNFTQQENFLALDEALIQMGDEEGKTIKADFTVSILTVLNREAGLGNESDMREGQGS